jgi:hypothetical protein
LDEGSHVIRRLGLINERVQEACGAWDQARPEAYQPSIIPAPAGSPRSRHPVLPRTGGHAGPPVHRLTRTRAPGSIQPYSAS